MLSSRWEGGESLGGSPSLGFTQPLLEGQWVAWSPPSPPPPRCMCGGPIHLSLPPQTQAGQIPDWSSLLTPAPQFTQHRLPPVSRISNSHWWGVSGKGNWLPLDCTATDSAWQQWKKPATAEAGGCTGRTSSHDSHATSQNLLCPSHRGVFHTLGSGVLDH